MAGPSVNIGLVAPALFCGNTPLKVLLFLTPLPSLSSPVLMPPMLKQWALPTPFSWPRDTFHITALLVSSLRVITVLLLTSWTQLVNFDVLTSKNSSLKRSTHLPFPFPPFYGVTLHGNSTNVRIFLRVLLVITRNNPSLLNCCPIPFLPSLSHFPLPFLPSTLLLFPLLFLLLPLPLPFTNLLTSRSPPSLSLLAKLFIPLRYSATFEPSKKAPLHLPRYLSFIAPQQMISEDAFTPWRLGPPNFLGITAPFCLVVPTFKLTLLALIISSSNVSLSLSLLDISLPSVDQLRALLSADFIASHPHFLEQYPTSPKDLPTILLNSSLESTLFYYRGKGYWPSHQVRALLHQISQTTINH